MGSAQGALAGAAAGAAMGSVVPGWGTAIGAVGGGLMGAFGGGGGKAASAAPTSAALGPDVDETNQNVRLDIENNNIGSPINVNIGSTQRMPDASLGTQAAYGYLPDHQTVALTDYGALGGGNVMGRMSRTLVNPVANSGWNPLIPPWEREEPAQPAPPTTGSRISLPVVLGVAVVLVVLIARKRR